MKVEIKTSLQIMGGNLWHAVFPIYKDDVISLIDGDRRVIMTMPDLATYHVALMHDGIGDFFININKEVQKKYTLVEDTEIKIFLEKDTSKYGMPVPEEFTELWSFDAEFKQFFHELTPGKQRNLLHLVNKMKTKPSRLKKALTIRDYLVDVKGKLDFKELNIAFKLSKH